MLKNRGIIRNQNHLNQTRDNFVISSSFPPKHTTTTTTTIPTQSITFLIPKTKKKKKPNIFAPKFSSLLSFQWSWRGHKLRPKMTILSFTFFSLFTLTVGLDYQLLGLTTATTTKASGERYVQMRAGAPFKIALFADLHFGEATSTDWGPLQDVNSTRVMNTVLDDETPGNVITSIYR